MRIPKPAIYAILAALGVILATILVALRHGSDIFPLAYKEVNSIVEVHALYGSVSSLGCFAWLIAGAIALFASQIVRNRGEAREANFLLAGSLLSLYSGFDDFFMIHEWLLAVYLGMDEKYPFLALGISFFAYAYWYRDIIRRMAWPFLAGAILLFIGSVGLDTLFEWYGKVLDGWSWLVEDAPKFLGIILWAIFHIDAAHSLLVGGEPEQA